MTFRNLWKNRERSDRDWLRRCAKALAGLSGEKPYVSELEKISKSTEDSSLIMATAIDLFGVAMATGNEKRKKIYADRLLEMDDLPEGVLQGVSHYFERSGSRDDLVSFIEARMSTDPKDLMARRLASGLHAREGNFDESLELLEGLIADGHRAWEVNNLAWYALCGDRATERHLELLQDTQPSDASSLHTLAVLQATQGMLIEAHATAHAALQAGDVHEMGPGYSLLYGRIGEEIGEDEIARDLYELTLDLEDFADDATGAHALARRWLARLDSRDGKSH